MVQHDHEQEKNGHEPELSELERTLETVRSHLLTAHRELERIPKNVPIRTYEQYPLIEEIVRNVIMSLEIRQAVTPPDTMEVTLLWLATGREMNATIYNQWTDPLGTKHALSKLGRGVKEVYYSRLMNRWVVAD